MDLIIRAAQGVIKGGKAMVDKILDWWKAEEEFTDKSGEKHRLFIKGKDVNAKLMMHSVEKEVIKHIEVYKKDPTTQAQAQRAEQLYQEFIEQKAIVIKGGGTPAATKTASTRIQGIINELSQIFRNLPGNFTDAEYPRPWEFESNGDKPTNVKAKYLTDEVQYGSKPGDGAGVTGWSEIDRLGLTQHDDDGWIQFHLLNDNLGGLGEPNNLVPTPNSVNRAYAKFESQTYKLVFNTTKRGQNQNQPGQKNIVWLDVKVVYRKGKYQGKDMSSFVERVEASSGIYIYRPKDGKITVKKRWIKDPKKVYSITLQVPNPYLMADGVNLNQNGQQQIESFLNGKGVDITRKVLDILVANRLYTDKTDLAQKLTPLLTGIQLDSRVDNATADQVRIKLKDDILRYFDNNLDSK